MQHQYRKALQHLHPPRAFVSVPPDTSLCLGNVSVSTHAVFASVIIEITYSIIEINRPGIDVFFTVISIFLLEIHRKLFFICLFCIKLSPLRIDHSDFSMLSLRMTFLYIFR